MTFGFFALIGVTMGSKFDFSSVPSKPRTLMPFFSASALKRSEEHTSELQSRLHLVCRLLLEKKKANTLHHASNCYKINNLPHSYLSYSTFYLHQLLYLFRPAQHVAFNSKTITYFISHIDFSF